MSNTEWSGMLSRHHEMLQAHLILLENFQEKEKSNKHVHATAKQCWDDAQRIVKSFEKLRTSVEQNGLETGNDSSIQQEAMKTNGRASGDEHDIEGARSHKRPRIEQDLPLRSSSLEEAESLFTIDTKPTAVDQLLSDTNKTPRQNGKRKLDQSNPDDMSNTKRGESFRKGSTHDDEFDAKVAQKQAEKEAKRQKKLEKKRKRESATTLEDHAQAEAWPTKKKRQKGQPAANNGENSNGNKTRKIDKSKKRLLGKGGSEGGRNKKNKI